MPCFAVFLAVDTMKYCGQFAHLKRMDEPVFFYVIRRVTSRQWSSSGYVVRRKKKKNEGLHWKWIPWASWTIRSDARVCQQRGVGWYINPRHCTLFLASYWPLVMDNWPPLYFFFLSFFLYVYNVVYFSCRTGVIFLALAAYIIQLGRVVMSAILPLYVMMISLLFFNTLSFIVVFQCNSWLLALWIAIQRWTESVHLMKWPLFTLICIHSAILGRRVYSIPTHKNK